MSNVSLMTSKYPHIRSCCLIKWQFFRGIHIFLYDKIESFTLCRNRPRQRALSGEHICVSLRQFFLCCALHWWMSWSVASESTSSRAKKLGKAISGEAVESSRDMSSGLHEANCSLDKSKQAHKRASKWNGAEWNRMKKSWGDITGCAFLMFLFASCSEKMIDDKTDDRMRNISRGLFADGVSVLFNYVSNMLKFSMWRRL